MGNVPSFLNPFSGLSSKHNGMEEYTAWQQQAPYEEPLTEDEDEPMEEVSPTENEGIANAISDGAHQQLRAAPGLEGQTSEPPGQGQLAPTLPVDTLQQALDSHLIFDQGIPQPMEQENGNNHGSENSSESSGISLSSTSTQRSAGSAPNTVIPHQSGMNTRSMAQINRRTAYSDGRRDTVPTVRIIPTSVGRAEASGTGTTNAVENSISGTPPAPPTHKLDPKATNKTGRFVCICGVHCKTMKSHKRHVEYSMTRGKFPCKFCPKRFIYLGHLTQHERQTHEYREMRLTGMGCRKCGLVFIGRVDLMFHHMHSHGYNPSQPKRASLNTSVGMNQVPRQPKRRGVPRTCNKRKLAVCDENRAKRFKRMR